MLSDADVADGDVLPFLVTPFTVHRPWSDIWNDEPTRAVWVTERIGDFLRRLAVR